MKVFIIWLSFVLGTSFFLSSPSSAQPLKIDTSASKVTVHVYKAGLFSAFGDNHTIAAPLASATLDTEKRSVELTFKVKDMKVEDPGSNDSKRQQVESNMKGEKVLDGARFPEIKFVSTSVEQQGGTNYLVHGNLSLHGTTKPVNVPVSFKDGQDKDGQNKAGQDKDGSDKAGHYSGTVKLKQTDFGITPITIAGGAVKVKDVIEIDFDIVTTPSSSAQR